MTIEPNIARREGMLVDELQKRNYLLKAESSDSTLISFGFAARDFVHFCNDIGFPAKLAGDYDQDGSPRTASGTASKTTEELIDSNTEPNWGFVRVSAGSESESQRLLQLIDLFNSLYALIFDLDGTLVDTSQSFDATIKELVLRHSGDKLEDAEIASLRSEGGFNDDWVATSELLKRRGKQVPHAQIVQEATKLYLEIAPKTESLLFELDLLTRLSGRYRVFIVTGRTRQEYNPIWSERLCPLFHKVYCLDDIAHCKPKPSPDYMLHLKQEFNIKYGAYVGNAVDDMWAARDAQLDRIGITTTLSAQTLRQAGAQIIIERIEELERIYSV